MNALRNSSKPISIAIVGDSTVADYPQDNKLRGWGQLLPEFFKGCIKIRNFARSGESSKSFIKNGLWDQALKSKADYYLIQFGHNDCPGKEERTTDPNSDYQEYLCKYISDVRVLGGHPVLVTPMERRNYKADGTIELTLDKYAVAMKVVGEKYNVPVIDLNKKSIELYENLGDEGSSYLMSTRDRTHFVEAGAREIARMVAREMCKKVPDLRCYNIECK